jgi:acetyl-CoA C-acetyltransferase
MLAAASIKAGDEEAVVAGGQESMSNAPYLVYGYRGGVKFGDQKLVDALIKDGLWCSFCDVHMGGHADYTARKANVTRQEQDVFSALSHSKAVAAIESGKFKAEIAPAEVTSKKGTTVIDTDEGPRKDTTADTLAKLRPAFGGKDKSEEQSVTAGNSSTLNDGAAALVVVSEQFAKDHGLEIMARITGYATGGGEPEDLFFAPIIAVQKLMKKTGAKIGDYDLIEANEAFASQSIADARGLAWDDARVNVHGGAIALGHPIGASGARILTTLLYALKDRGKRTGLATLCLGGGNAVALSVERPS